MVTHEDVLAALGEVAQSTTTAEIKLDVPLIRQGFDSLDIASLMFALESKYNKPIPPEKSARLRSIADITTFLNA